MTISRVCGENVYNRPSDRTEEAHALMQIFFCTFGRANHFTLHLVIGPSRHVHAALRYQSPSSVVLVVHLSKSVSIGVDTGRSAFRWLCSRVGFGSRFRRNCCIIWTAHNFCPANVCSCSDGCVKQTQESQLSSSLSKLRVVLQSVSRWKLFPAPQRRKFLFILPTFLQIVFLQTRDMSFLCATGHSDVLAALPNPRQRNCCHITPVRAPRLFRVSWGVIYTA